MRRPALYALVWILSATSSLAQSFEEDGGAALERLAAVLNMSRSPAISDVAQAFGLPIEDRPTRWIEGNGIERDFVWKNSLQRSPITEVTFAEEGEGSYLSVQVNNQQCPTPRDIERRFDARIQYVQQPVPDTGMTSDTDRIQGLEIQVGSRERYIDGLVFRSTERDRMADKLMERCLLRFNIDGEPRVFIGNTPTP